jgi:hypothetical protein
MICTSHFFSLSAGKSGAWEVGIYARIVLLRMTGAAMVETAHPAIFSLEMNMQCFTSNEHNLAN